MSVSLVFGVQTAHSNAQAAPASHAGVAAPAARMSTGRASAHAQPTLSWVTGVEPPTAAHAPLVTTDFSVLSYALVALGPGSVGAMEAASTANTGTEHANAHPTAQQGSLLSTIAQGAALIAPRIILGHPA